jgi:hypothetical protein
MLVVLCLTWVGLVSVSLTRQWSHMSDVQRRPYRHILFIRSSFSNRWCLGVSVVRARIYRPLALHYVGQQNVDVLTSLMTVYQDHHRPV